MLTLVPTPIGNLEDISLRAVKCLEEAELLLCEDTRVTKKLLSLLSSKLNIDFQNKDFISCHSHNEKTILSKLDIDILRAKNVVYVSDAGMPCISDPGALLVEFCIENQIEYDVLPGANAVLTAFAMAGFNETEFSFFGFLPHKGKDRASKLQRVMSNNSISILYESPHRLLKLLEELVVVDENREIFLVKELTKLHQKSYKGISRDVYSELKSENIKGEWVVIIKNSDSSNEQQLLGLEDIKDLDLPPKQKAKLIAKVTGRNTKEIYQEILGN